MNQKNQIFMVTVEKVSPTGATITITFMVMVTAAINLGSLWRDFEKPQSATIIKNVVYCGQGDACGPALRKHSNACGKSAVIR
jgi:hypothetical protein